MEYSPLVQRTGQHWKNTSRVRRNIIERKHFRKNTADCSGNTALSLMNVTCGIDRLFGVKDVQFLPFRTFSRVRSLSEPPACFHGILERIWIKAKVKPNAANAPTRHIFAGPHAFCLPVPKRKKATRKMGPLPNIQKTWTAVERCRLSYKTPMTGHGSAAPTTARLLAAGCRKRSQTTATMAVKTPKAEKSRRMADTQWDSLGVGGDCRLGFPQMPKGNWACGLTLRSPPHAIQFPP